MAIRSINGNDIELEDRFIDFMELAYAGQFESGHSIGSPIGVCSYNTDSLSSVVQLYTDKYRLLSKPFSDIEVNAKYDIILEAMQTERKGLIGSVNDGVLTIELGSGVLIKFKKTDWALGLGYIQVGYDIGIDKYADEYYYDYIEWARGQVLSGNTTVDFYKCFATTLYNAANDNSFKACTLAYKLYKRSLDSLERTNIDDYVILDTRSNKECFIDIYEYSKDTLFYQVMFRVYNGNNKLGGKYRLLAYEPAIKEPKWVSHVAHYMITEYIHEYNYFKGVHYNKATILEIDEQIIDIITGTIIEPSNTYILNADNMHKDYILLGKRAMLGGYTRLEVIRYNFISQSKTTVCIVYERVASIW